LERITDAIYVRGEAEIEIRKKWPKEVILQFKLIFASTFALNVSSKISHHIDFPVVLNNCVLKSLNQTRS
jgi:hypothetical protein